MSVSQNRKTLFEESIQGEPVGNEKIRNLTEAYQSSLKRKICFNIDCITSKQTDSGETFSNIL